MPRAEFVNPKFKGARFDDHHLPVDVLGEFKAYNDLVLALSKHLYLAKHDDRERVPRGFADQLQLKITSIERGSVAVKIERVYIGAGQDYPEFEEARDLIDQVISNDQLPARFPERFLSHFEVFGKSLRDDEAIEFSVPGQPHSKVTTYTKQKRLKLISSNRQTIESCVLLTGRITTVDLVRKRFTILLEDQTELQGSIQEGLSEALRDAHRQSENRDVLLMGKASTFENKSIAKFDQVQHLVIYNEDKLEFAFPELAKKASEIKALKVGWYDGDGTAFDGAFVNSTVSALESLLKNKKIPFPYLYPTPDGAIQAEWSMGSWDVSLAFSNEYAYLHAASLSSPETIENRFSNWQKESTLFDIGDFLVKKFIDIVA